MGSIDNEQLVKSVELEMVINGKLGGYFKPTCGIHRGDPLSPLFFFVSEAMSSLIIYKNKK